MSKAKLISKRSAIIAGHVVATDYDRCNCSIAYKYLWPALSIAPSFRLVLPLLVGLVFLTNAPTALAQLTLGIITTNRQVLLYWPSSYPNCVLQTCTNLSTANWVEASDAVPATYGSQIAVTVSNLTQVRFFRLCYTNQTTAPSDMVLIPAGSFQMGDTLDELSDALPTNVFVSAFYMDTNPVTYVQWQTVYNYATNNGYDFAHPGSGKDVNHPVQQVNWYDAVKWCNARSEMEGRVPVYYTDTDQTTIYRTGNFDASNGCVNWNANGYRLPTEAEWEKAARGGLTEQRFPWGTNISQSLANYYGDTSSFDYDLGPDGYNAIGSLGGTTPATSPAGAFAPNGYGLFDMAGNVEEWCWDRYASPPYPPGSPYLGGNDPRGPDTGNILVIRGAGWDDGANFARCANRLHFAQAGYAYSDLGFRCVLTH